MIFLCKHWFNELKLIIGVIYFEMVNESMISYLLTIKGDLESSSALIRKSNTTFLMVGFLQNKQISSIVELFFYL